MTTTKLQEAIRAVPFRPFSIVMPDGTELHVPHPDYIAHAPNGRTAVVMRDDDSSSFVDLLLVGELRFSPPPSAAPPPALAS